MQVLTLGFVLAAFAAGCRTTGQPASEVMVDKEIVGKPAPNTAPDQATQQEPRPGYEQEPAGKK